MNSDNEAKLALRYAKFGLSWTQYIEVYEALLAKETDEETKRQYRTCLSFFRKWKAEATQPGIAVPTDFDDDSPMERSGVRELKLDGSDYADALNWSDGEDNG
jgi:hypothetical protein